MGDNTGARSLKEFTARVGGKMSKLSQRHEIIDSGVAGNLAFLLINFRVSDEEMWKVKFGKAVYW